MLPFDSTGQALHSSKCMCALDLWLVLACHLCKYAARQKNEGTVASTAAGISHHHESQHAEELPDQPLLTSFLPQLASLLSAGTSSTNMLSSMQDIQCRLQAQFKQQHHQTA